MSRHKKEVYVDKTRLYLEPPIPGRTTVRKKVTTIVPAPKPPPPPVTIIEEPPPPPVLALPPPPPPPPPIEMITVDVEPSVTSKRSSKSSKSSRSSSRTRKPSKEWDREVYIERERVVPIRVPVRVPVPVHVPVPVPMPVQPVYETYQYIEAPREERERVVVEDRRRTREYYRRV